MRSRFMILKPTYMMSEVFMDCGQLLFGTDWHTNCGNGACSFADILISAMQRIIYRNIRVAVEYWNIPPPLLSLKTVPARTLSTKGAAGDSTISISVPRLEK